MAKTTKPRPNNKSEKAEDEKEPGGPRKAVDANGAASSGHGRRIADKESSGRRRHKQNNDKFSYLIFKVLRQVHPDIGISARAMAIMNSFTTYDIFERIASESSQLVKHTNKQTLLTRDIQASVRLLLPGEPAKHVVNEGTKAVTKYMSIATEG